MFGIPMTPLQVKMINLNARQRGVLPENLPLVRTLILKAYGVNDANSKGNASLFIDWLMNASDEIIEAAISASVSYGEPTPRKASVVHDAA
jgi:hypothetical protein